MSYCLCTEGLSLDACGTRHNKMVVVVVVVVVVVAQALGKVEAMG